MGGVVINTETGARHENATLAECSDCPSDLGTVGYEYHAGVFKPCAPYGKSSRGSVMVACHECATPRRSEVSIENGTIGFENADGNDVFKKERVVNDVTHKAAVSVGSDGATVLKHYQGDEVKGQVETDSEGAFWRSVPAGERRSLLTDIVVSSYTGDGAAERFIDLGFTPTAVIVAQNGSFDKGTYGGYGGFAVSGSPAKHANKTLVEIIENGFRVYNESTSSTTDRHTNQSGFFYNYMAVRR